MEKSQPFIHVADREGSKYLTVYDGKSLTLLENVKAKVANSSVAQLQEGVAPLDALGSKSKVFSCQSIKKLVTAEHEDNVALWYTDGDKEKKYTVAMDGYPEQIKLMELIGKSMPDAKRSEEPVPVWQAIIGPGLTTVGIVAGTALFAYLAADPESADYEPTGRRRGMKRLLIWLTQTLGTSGIIAIGVILLLGALVWMYKRISSPPVKTVIERI